MFFDYARYYLPFALQILTASGLLMGNAWAWLGVSTLILFAVIDSILPDDHSDRRITNASVANIPLWLTTLGGPTLVLLLAWTSAQGNFTGIHWVGAVLSTTWMTVIAFVPTVHELYHQRAWLPQVVGNYCQVIYLDCTRNAGHIVGHHIDVGTEADSDTARRGTSLYAFTPKAVWDSTRISWNIESDALEKRGHGRWSMGHKLWKAILAQLAFLTMAFLLGGWIGVAIALTSVVVARFWVESFNYFQHYGVVRVPGKPIARRHLWNHLGFCTRMVTTEITNHADHHLDSYIPYYKLKPDTTAIKVPNAFWCFFCALIPPIWHRFIIMPALQEWDAKFASAGELELARKQNEAAGWPNWFDEIEQQRAAAS